MSKQLGFLIDLSKCVGCRNCEVACSNEHRLDQTHYRHVISFQSGHRDGGFLSLSCNHCLNPECIRVCQKKCFYKRRDGIVIYRPQNCNGCQNCVGACPFGAPKYQVKSKKVMKCNFCVERIDRGLGPACVEACVVGALQVMDVFQPTDQVFQKNIPHFPVAQITKPSIRFILPKPPQCFWRKS